MWVTKVNDNHTMLTTTSVKWLPRVWTFLVWALVAGSVAYWGLRWSGAESQVLPAPPALPLAASMDTAAVARALGNAGTAVKPAVSSSSRFVLVGVVARTASRTGAALIAVDGKPAKPVAVGAKVEEGLFLLTVAARRASLGPQLDGPATVSLELPAPKL